MTDYALCAIRMASDREGVVIDQNLEHYSASVTKVTLKIYSPADNATLGVFINDMSDVVIGVQDKGSVPVGEPLFCVAAEFSLSSEEAKNEPWRPLLKKAIQYAIFTTHRQGKDLTLPPSWIPKSAKKRLGKKVFRELKANCEYVTFKPDGEIVM